MKNRILFFLLICIIPMVTHANLRPVATVTLGADLARPGMNQTITVLAPFQNTYISTQDHDTEFFGGLFLGLESSFAHNILLQLGLSYYQNSPFLVEGVVSQFANPSYKNLTYQFHIESLRFMMESKLLATIKQDYHPYVVGGLGEAINRSFGYSEFPITTDSVPMEQPFSNHTNRSFTYMVGIGLDYDINTHFRLGCSYRFSSLGQPGLGTSPLQDGADTLRYRNFYANEFLVQLSYV